MAELQWQQLALTADDQVGTVPLTAAAINSLDRPMLCCNWLLHGAWRFRECCAYSIALIMLLPPPPPLRLVRALSCGESDGTS